MYNHITDRNLVKWGSYGKYGNEPLRETLIRDLSDSHLMRVVEHIKDRIHQTGMPKMLRLMQEEVHFRTHNYIFVPDTY